jgi:hypothetical protein
MGSQSGCVWLEWGVGLGQESLVLAFCGWGQQGSLGTCGSYV